MDYVLGALAGFVVFVVLYAILSFVIACVLKGMGRLDLHRSATNPAFLVALAAGGYAFYSVALA